MCTSTRCDRPDPAAAARAERMAHRRAYLTTHQHLRRRRGPASSFDCVDCGKRAQQWSFSGPVEQGERAPYSTDLSLYEPRCCLCHARFDAAYR